MLRGCSLSLVGAGCEGTTTTSQGCAIDGNLVGLVHLPAGTGRRRSGSRLREWRHHGRLGHWWWRLVRGWSCERKAIVKDVVDRGVNGSRVPKVGNDRP